MRYSSRVYCVLCTGVRVYACVCSCVRVYTCCRWQLDLGYFIVLKQFVVPLLFRCSVAVLLFRDSTTISPGQTPMDYSTARKGTVGLWMPDALLYCIPWVTGDGPGCRLSIGIAGALNLNGGIMTARATLGYGMCDLIVAERKLIDEF